MAKNRKELVIKKVDVATFDELLYLIGKLAEFEKLTPPDKEAKERLRKDYFSGKPRFEALIGEIDGKCVAYTLYFFTYSSFLASPTLFLEDIFVLEEYRRHGIGKRMFEYCREIAERRGCGRIEFAVLTWNVAAQRFYEGNKAERLDWFFYRLNQENF